MLCVFLLKFAGRFFAFNPHIAFDDHIQTRLGFGVVIQINQANFMPIVGEAFREKPVFFQLFFREISDD
jgi:hypothetical protein